MAALKEVPLFPLKAILFPGQAMALHIFEDRYRLMINTCLRTTSRWASSLIREGEEVGGTAVPYPVGTLAAVTETTRQEDGQFDIMAVGQERFIIRAIVQAGAIPDRSRRGLSSDGRGQHTGAGTDVPGA